MLESSQTEILPGEAAIRKTLARPPSDGPGAPQPDGPGRLIVNADDWGLDRQTTGKTLDCVLAGTVSAVSAMVFMEDSERAAELAKESRIDVGLHLNFTQPFSTSRSTELTEHHRRIVAFLRLHPLARVLYHPGLKRSFEYVTAAQRSEFRRLYGKEPQRFDGHHHMHLCSNVLVDRLLPENTVVRRNFSFRAGEKGRINRFYRRFVDHRLAKNHRLTDYLFSIQPLEPQQRLVHIFDLSRDEIVELETHPCKPDEYRFLSRPDAFDNFGIKLSNFEGLKSKLQQVE